ncbi:hypothetical protein U1Q18_004329 [Sarracenia purpurea var. burkii]
MLPHEIQTHPWRSMPMCLTDFLTDKEICFVGFGIQQGLPKLAQLCSPVFKVLNASGLPVEVAGLAAIVLKKPKLMSVGLDALAAELEISLESTAVVPVNVGAQAFSHEEIKCLIRDVYKSYLIGKKLLGSL